MSVWRSRVAYCAVLFGVVVVFVAALLAMGRVPWCECGYVKLWHGVVHSSENSQHLTDWYTFTHFIHGFGLYLALSLLGPGWSLATRFLLATAGEAAWEVFENTPFVIERYRAETISLDYYGDSVVNALGDLVASDVGFLFAARVPVWATLAAFVVLEGALACIIRDNLTLNVLMLVWPIEAIKRWQSGG
jgi:hypothetical protein